MHYGYVVLAVSVLAVTGALGFGRFAYTLILPGMREGLALSYAQAGLLASGNFVGYLLAALGCGLLAGRLGPRRVIAGGLTLTGGTMLATGLAAGFETALAARALTGVGSAGANVSAMSLVAAWVSRPRRGLAAGLLVAGSGIGLLVAGQVVPRVAAAGGPDGWRHNWLLLGAAVVGLAALAALLLRDHPRERGLEPLWAGGGGKDEPALVERPGCPAPPDGRPAWRVPAIWHLGLIYCAFGFSYIIYATFFATHLLGSGVGATQAGDLWGLVGLLSLGSGVAWGSASDRLGRSRALAMVFGVQMAAFALFALGAGLTAFVASAVLFGAAGWSVPAIMAAAVGDYVEVRQVPTGLGLLTLVFGVGQAVGPGVAGSVADVTGSFSLAFGLAAGVGLLGLLASLLLRPASGAGAGRRSR